MRKRKADKGPRDNVPMVKADRHLADQFPTAREDHGAATDQVKLRVFTQASDLTRKPLRKADIVGIHPRDELAFRERNRLIETRRQSGGTRFPDQANALVMKALDDRAALVG